MIELTVEGRAWAEGNDLNPMADVVIDPAPWPPRFVRLAVRYANDAGAEAAARVEFRAAIDRVGSATVLDLLRAAT